MDRLDLTAPFVLLDDARPGGAPARLFRELTETIVASEAGAIASALARLREVVAAGRAVAGFLSYGAGAALEPRLAPLARGSTHPPLLWFGVFDRVDTVADVTTLLPEPRGARIGAVTPPMTRDEYGAAFERVQALIAAGDIYQANLTFTADADTLGDPLALYAAIRPRAAAGWGGIVWTGSDCLLSFSPEMFFTLNDGVLTARPMKGTARRADDAAEDRARASALAADAKQRAENLMIVDLLRNDLTRVASPGSVAVPALFEVESYPTVHQMTSTVTAALGAGKDAVDVLAALFPCGSVTGAPKIRAMEVIATIEPMPRGVYTGAIGAIEGGRAAFNVAIRTLHLGPGNTTATIGLGSGVVADSRAEEEWDECLAKAAFLTAGQRSPDLIETMAFDPEEGIALLDLHLARMKTSAEALGYAFDRHGARNELQAATFRLRHPARVRLLTAKSGAVAIEIAAMPPAPPSPAPVTAVPLPVAPSDWRLRHKTTDRKFYDAARQAAGTFEVIFALPDGRLTEGSFTSLFVEKDGLLVTPPFSLGLLPGILCQSLIDRGEAIEGDVTIDDLAGGFLLGNALRGLFAAAIAK